MKVRTKKEYAKGRTIEKHAAEYMKDPGFKEAWHNLDAEFGLLESMIKAREQAGITQAELAERIGTKQPALSRLERGGFKKATVETLKKIADALDARLVIKLQHKKTGSAIKGQLEVLDRKKKIKKAS